MIIYMVRNLINHNVYIGKTSKPLLKFRRSGHIKSSKNNPKCYFHLAIRKHGIQNFKWYILNSNAKTVDELNRLEIECIASYKNKGVTLYNMTNGGDGNTRTPKQKPQKVPESIRRAKISNTLKGRAPWNKGIKTGPLDLKVYKKIVETRRLRDNYKVSEETKLKISQTLKNNTISKKNKIKSGGLI